MPRMLAGWPGPCGWASRPAGWLISPAAFPRNYMPRPAVPRKARSRRRSRRGPVLITLRRDGRTSRRSVMSTFEKGTLRMTSARLFAVVLTLVPCTLAAAGEMEGIRVSANPTGFVYETSGRPFVPWGFNYDHDAQGRLLEDYWEKEWPKVEEDFRAIKRLGANVVRIHLQVSRFLDSAETANEASLARLARLVALAEHTHLYLDITGLGCYRIRDVPAWYDRLSEEGRWKAQARFWEAVAQRCAKSPAVFCYDLMNEPNVPGGARQPGDWLGPPFLGNENGFFVQFITLDQKNRTRPAIAREWCHQLATAIRQHDRHRLVTVGLVPWS